MKAKKIYAALILLAALLMTGCTPIVAEVPHSTSVYATFYPIYAITAAITEGADDIEVHCLVQPQDECLRSYTLSDWDLYMLNYSADMIISAGNGLEGFSEQLEKIGESIIPVAEAAHGLELYSVNGISDDENHFSGENPHLYMSFEGAKSIAENIEGALSLLNETKADVFNKNLVCFIEEIDAKHEMITKKTEVCKSIPAAVLHESLFYTAQDCGLDVRTWFERESGEMLYGAALDECLNAFKQSEVKIVLLENQAPDALVQKIQNAGYAVAKLDVMSTLSEVDGYEAYLDVLEHNALAVAEACGDLRK